MPAPSPRVALETIAAVRRVVALLLSPVLFFQACTTANAPGSFTLENELSRVVIDGTIGLKADPNTAQHLVDAEEASRLEEAGVIPLRLVIRNLGTREVIVESAGMTLQLNDGRVLQGSAAPPIRWAEHPRTSENAPTFDNRSSVSETPPSNQPPADLQVPNDSVAPPVEPPVADMKVPPVEPPATSKEAPKGFGRELGVAVLAGVLGGALPYILAAAIMTSPIWGPPVLISRYVKKKSEERERKAEEERLSRTSSLEQLQEVHLMQGEAAEGLLYFAVEGERPDTLATATLIVPVHHPDTGEAHSVRLPLGAEK